MRDRNTLVYEKLDDETEKQNDRSRIKTPNTRNDDLADMEINVNGGTSNKIIKHLDSRRTQEGCVSGCKQDRQRSWYTWRNFFAWKTYPTHTVEQPHKWVRASLRLGSIFSHVYEFQGDFRVDFKKNTLHKGLWSVLSSVMWWTLE